MLSCSYTHIYVSHITTYGTHISRQVSFAPRRHYLDLLCWKLILNRKYVSNRNEEDLCNLNKVLLLAFKNGYMHTTPKKKNFNKTKIVSIDNEGNIFY